MDLTLSTILLLFLAASIAGFMDTLAGGGGLITIPALALTGSPMLMVLGTNKLQGCAGTATASGLLFKNKKFTFSEIKTSCLFAFLGAAAGSLAVQFVDKQALKFIVPMVLFFIGFYFLLSPYIKAKSEKTVISQNTFTKAIVPGIGFYDGMFGPGTGSFFSLAGVSLRKQTLLQATTFAKPLNLATNFASLIIFMSMGQVIWLAGLIMMMGQFLGATAGAHFLYKIKPEILRLLVVLVCFSMLGHYIYREFFNNNF